MRIPEDVRDLESHVGLQNSSRKILGMKKKILENSRNSKGPKRLILKICFNFF